MGKQQWSVAIVAILVAVAAPASAQDGDPNLMGWWTFDGDTLDSSGNGRDGTLMGDATLVDFGLHGGALSLDGSGDYVNIDGYKGVGAVDEVQHPFTVANWFKTTGNAEMVTWGDNPGRQRLSWRIDGGRLRTEHGSGNLRGNTYVNDGEWHHGALVVNEGANLRVPNTLIYVDGVEDTTFSGSDNTYNLGSDTDVSIGRRATSNDRWFNGLIDDVRIYDRVLATEELAELAMRPRSYKPDPAPGALVEATQVLLQWTPGGFANEHDVYFGTNPTPGPDELVGRQADAQYMALNLEQEKTYYWRIDDVEADGTTIRTGDVWSFWVPPKRAYDPQPLDGLINVFTDAQLSWTPGWSPLMHAVYFGTNADEVANMAGAMPQMDALSDPGPLELETTYYWRVDEFYAGQWVAGPVWSFTTVPPIAPIDEPNLVAWYPLEEGAGRTALDQTGNDHHASFTGDPEWTAGYDGGGLMLSGLMDKEYFKHALPEASVWPAFTVGVWVKANMVGQRQYSGVFASHVPNTAGFQIDTNGGDPGVYRVNPPGGTTLAFGPVTTEWVHLALTCEDANAVAYYNGFLGSTGTLTETNVTFNEFAFGINRNDETSIDGVIDDARVYDKAFTEEEIRRMFADVRIAWQPQPPEGTVGDILTITSVSWTPGDGAVAHDVYLSDDPNALAAADASDATGIYRGRQAETVYAPPEELSLGQTYYWRIDEVDADGNVAVGNVWSFTLANSIIVEPAEMALVYDNTVEPYVTEIALDIAQDWSHPDLVDLSLEFQGAPPVFVEDADGVITMSGAGADIWGTADECRFAFTEISGDATIVAQVLSNGTGSNAWAKGGVMIRQSLDADSANVMGAITGGSGDGGTFQWRPSAGAVSGSSRTLIGIAPPYWVRLVREGNTFTVSLSADGVEWAQEGETPVDVNMVDPVLIGLAVTSHQSGELRAFEFADISINDAPAGDLQVVDVGVEQGGSNDAAALYVAVEDAAGGSAVVAHPDPAATNIAEWTEWRVSLADLTAGGVDLAAVVKVAVGVGDGQPDGTGAVTIRNIQVVPPVAPVITVAPAEVEATGDDGMVLSINGIVVEDLILGTTSTDFEKWPDHPAPDADDFDLGTYASLDDSGYITIMFDVPVSTVFIIERGANDLGLLQPLDAAGDPVGGLAAFAKSDWFKPGIKINGQDAGAIVITAEVPISGIMVLPAEGAGMGLDPASVSAIPAE